MRTELPLKWKLRATVKNVSVLNDYFHSISHHYVGYNKNWLVQSDSIVVFPQKEAGCWGYCNITIHSDKDYEEITFEEFQLLVLNKSLEPNYEIY